MPAVEVTDVTNTEDVRSESHIDYWCHFTRGFRLNLAASGLLLSVNFEEEPLRGRMAVALFPLHREYLKLRQRLVDILPRVSRSSEQLLKFKLAIGGLSMIY